MPQGPLSANIATQTKAGVTSYKASALDLEGNLQVGQGVPLSYASAYAGIGGMIMNPSGVTSSIALATTYLGLCLSNPAASGKNLVLTRVGFAFLVIPAAYTNVALITGFAAGGITAHTTALTPQSTLVGRSAAALVGLADSACTLVGTPVWSRILGSTPGATTAFNADVDVAGSIIVPPGGYVAIGTSAASPASGFLGSMMWIELPQ